MAETFVPLTTGSDEAVITNASAFTATDVRFPPSSALPFHLHERTVFAVILAGSFEGVFPGKHLPCEPGTVLTEPAGEKHGNRFGRHGARVLVLEADSERTDMFRPCGRLLERIALIVSDTTVVVEDRRYARCKTRKQMSKYFERFHWTPDDRDDRVSPVSRDQQTSSRPKIVAAEAGVLEGSNVL